MAQHNQTQFPEVNVSPKMVIAIVVFILLGLIAWSSYYTVPTNSVGVVVRLGKPLAEASPSGFHLKFPLGIDRVEIVPVERQLKLEFGGDGVSAGATNPFQSTSDWERRMERDMVTGDQNAVDVPWEIHYRISDPHIYLFHVRNPEMTLRDASESVMRQAIGDRTVEEVLTVGRASIMHETESSLRELIGPGEDGYNLGIEITSVILGRVTPPPALNDAFEDVNMARQEKNTKINVAKKERDGKVPRAEGAAVQQIAEAEGYALERVNNATGETTRFNALFTEYQKAPEVTKRRIYLETVTEIMPSLAQKVIIDSAASQVLPFLPLRGANIQPR